MKKVLYIINPISGIGKQKIIEKLISKYSDKTRVDYRITYTKKAKHAIEISKTEAANFDAIIAVGGDGSVNEVAQGLINTDTALGIIPTGSGNGFARHINLPLKLNKAIQRINNFEIEKVDVAKVNNVFAVNVIGVGFDALITHKFASYGKRGFSSYIKLTAKEFSRFKVQDIFVEIDGKKIETNIFLFTIANGSQYGNNAFIAPKASIQDGLLDIAILKKFPLISVPNLAYRLFTRKFDKFKYSETYKAKSIKITQKGKIQTQIDGEAFIFNNKIEVSILENALKILV